MNAKIVRNQHRIRDQRLRKCINVKNKKKFGVPMKVTIAQVFIEILGNFICNIKFLQEFWKFHTIKFLQEFLFKFLEIYSFSRKEKCYLQMNFNPKKLPRKHPVLTAHSIKSMNSSAHAPLSSASCSAGGMAFWQMSARRKAQPHGLPTRCETQWHSVRHLNQTI